MNIAEKKRAEQMVFDALGKGPKRVEAEASPSEALTECYKTLKGLLKKEHFHISSGYGSGGGLVMDSDHPAVEAANKTYEDAQKAHTKRQRDLIAAVWNGDYDFETLRVELTK